MDWRYDILLKLFLLQVSADVVVQEVVDPEEVEVALEAAAWVVAVAEEVWVETEVVEEECEAAWTEVEDVEVVTEAEEVTGMYFISIIIDIKLNIRPLLYNIFHHHVDG